MILYVYGLTEISFSGLAGGRGIQLPLLGGTVEQVDSSSLEKKLGEKLSTHFVRTLCFPCQLQLIAADFTFPYLYVVLQVYRLGVTRESVAYVLYTYSER